MAQCSYRSSRRLLECRVELHTEHRTCLLLRKPKPKFKLCHIDGSTDRQTGSGWGGVSFCATIRKPLRGRLLQTSVIIYIFIYYELSVT